EDVQRHRYPGVRDGREREERKAVHARVTGSQGEGASAQGPVHTRLPAAASPAYSAGRWLGESTDPPARGRPSACRGRRSANGPTTPPRVAGPPGRWAVPRPLDTHGR